MQMQLLLKAIFLLLQSKGHLVATALPSKGHLVSTASKGHLVATASKGHASCFNCF
jgi:hypothetical protein